MTEKTVIKQRREPLFHIVKRDDMVWWKVWGVRAIAIVASILVMVFISSLLTGKGMGKTVEIMYRGVFGRIEKGSFKMLFKYLEETAILLCLALALTPAFKMKFWNCGAEGQALMGGLGAMVCMIELEGKLPTAVLIPVIAVVSILCGAIWGVIPAIFKALFDTNETLFTLMMNYIATQIIAYYVYIKGGGSNVIQPVEAGIAPSTGNSRYYINISIVIAITFIAYIYLKYSKHGYEISVVGESRNTARYIGINVKKVIIRTMLISGAVCGIAGMILVAGKDHSIRTATVGGQGFTAIMMAWLGQCNPFITAFMTAIIVFLNLGAAKVADSCYLNSAFADIFVGVVILCVVGCEFFIRYSFKFRGSRKGDK
ncbi:MAG: ABC transporter permease [Clostridia bacterium]|nr:ABC transporter permease [Clostridia bacterium]